MNFLFYFILIPLFFSCTNSNEISGNWKFEIKLKEVELPFVMSIAKNKNQYSAKLYNAEETIELSNITFKDNKLDIELSNKVSLIGEVSGDKISGYWIKHERVPEYKVPFTAKKVKEPSRFSYKSDSIELDKKWKIIFSPQEVKKEYKQGILLIKETTPYIRASVLTKTGDYRYLEGVIRNNELSLYGFDGVFAFVFKAKVNKEIIKGKMYAGKSFSEVFAAKVDKDFELVSPESITSFTETKINFSLKDSSGNLVNLKDSQNRVTILQIFGSWCPNCIDETNFIKEWLNTNHNLPVDIYAIAFEREKDEKSALKTLLKVKNKLQMNYPILLGGATKQDTVSKVFPGIKNFISFPTTIYLDKKGVIRKVHAGFNGPATDFYYDEFKRNFDDFIKQLVRE